MNKLIESDTTLGSTRIWTYSTWTGLGLYAWGVVIAGAVLPDIAATYRLNPALTGGLLALPAVGFTLAGILGGYLSSLIGLQYLLVFSAYGLAFGLGLAANASSVIFFGIALLIVGLSGGMFEVGSNGLIAGMYPRVAARELNRLHIAFGIGAFISPIVAAGLLTRGIPWRANYTLSAIMVMLLAIFLTFQLKASEIYVSPATNLKLFGLARKRTLLFAWIGAFLFVASELGFSNWVGTYLRVDVGFTPQMASYAISLFWLSMLLGRYLNTFLPAWLKETKVVFIQATCGAAALYLTLSVYHSSFVFIGIILAGLFMAGILPWILAYANHTNPGNSGPISGFIQIGAGTGMLLGPAVIGLLYGASSLAFAMNITVILLLLLAIVFLRAT